MINDIHGHINNSSDATANFINSGGKDEYIILIILLLHIEFSVADIGNKRKHNEEVAPSTSQKKVFIKYKLY